MTTKIFIPVMMFVLCFHVIISMKRGYKMVFMFIVTFENYF